LLARFLRHALENAGIGRRFGNLTAARTVVACARVLLWSSKTKRVRRLEFASENIF
jgi:hypothetical protein